MPLLRKYAATSDVAAGASIVNGSPGTRKGLDLRLFFNYLTGLVQADAIGVHRGNYLQGGQHARQAEQHR